MQATFQTLRCTTSDRLTRMRHLTAESSDRGPRTEHIPRARADLLEPAAADTMYAVGMGSTGLPRGLATDRVGAGYAARPGPAATASPSLPVTDTAAAAGPCWRWSGGSLDPA